MSQANRQHIIKNCFVFFTLLVFITANVGLAVYTHTCSISGIEKSLFVSLDDPCSDEHPVQKKTCCSKEQHEEEHFETSCCSTDTDYVSLNAESRIEHAFLKLVSLEWIDIPALNSNYFAPANFIQEKEILSFSSLPPPPKLQGRDFNNLYQVYII